MVVVRSIDGKCAAMFQAQSITQAKDSEQSVLTLTREGSEMFVSSLSIGEMQVVFEYRIPKVAAAPALGMSTQPCTRRGGSGTSLSLNLASAVGARATALPRPLLLGDWRPR